MEELLLTLKEQSKVIRAVADSIDNIGISIVAGNIDYTIKYTDEISHLMSIFSTLSTHMERIMDCGDFSY